MSVGPVLSPPQHPRGCMCAHISQNGTTWTLERSLATPWVCPWSLLLVHRGDKSRGDWESMCNKHAGRSRESFTLLITFRCVVRVPGVGGHKVEDFTHTIVGSNHFSPPPHYPLSVMNSSLVSRGSFLPGLRPSSHFQLTSRGRFKMCIRICHSAALNPTLISYFNQQKIPNPYKIWPLQSTSSTPLQSLLTFSEEAPTSGLWTCTYSSLSRMLFPQTTRGLLLLPFRSLHEGHLISEAFLDSPIPISPLRHPLLPLSWLFSSALIIT